MPGEIVLYTLIPTAAEGRPIRRGAVARAKLAAQRLRDRLAWRLAGRFRLETWRYEERCGTNQGDIAVRDAVAGQVARALGPRLPQVRELAWNGLDAKELERVNRDASLLVVAGGGYLSIDAGGELIPRCVADLEALSGLRVPLALGAIGINATFRDKGHAETLPVSPDTERRLRRLGRQATALSVRDAFSQQVMAGCSGRTVPLVGDPALFLKPRSPRSRPGSGPPRIGINLAFHGRQADENLARTFPLYVDALERLHRETGCCFQYFRHSDAEPALARLLKAEGLPVELVEGGPQALLDAYAGLDLHIGEMMHSCILSLAAGTPALGVAYDAKTRGLYALMGLQDCLTDVFALDPGALAGRALAMLADRQDLAARIATRKSVLEQAHRAWWDGLLARAAA